MMKSSFVAVPRMGIIIFQFHKTNVWKILEFVALGFLCPDGILWRREVLDYCSYGFTGGWKNGKQHGRGSYTTAKGEVREGEWEEGRRLRWFSPMWILPVRMRY